MKIINLTPKDIGTWVEFNDGYKIQKGRIKSWNDSFIFVVFHCDNNWDDFKNYTGCACKSEYLKFLKT